MTRGNPFAVAFAMGAKEDVVVAVRNEQTSSVW